MSILVVYCKVFFRDAFLVLKGSRLGQFLKHVEKTPMLRKGQTERTTYYHCFGRHTEALGYDNIMIGSNEEMGQLPMTLLALAMDGQLDRVAAIGFGTGASKRGEQFEAEVAAEMMQHLYFNFHIWPRLAELGVVLNTLKMQDILQHPRIDIQSINTTQELELARDYMKSNGLQRFVGVTCGSHAARCINEAAKVFAGSKILVSIVSAETFYEGEKPGSTIVVEGPHRGDDPLLKAGIRLNQILARFFAIPALKKARAALGIEKLIEEHSN